MQETLWSAQLSARLASLFLPPPAVPVRLWAILDGIAPGRIMVDDTRHPTCAVIQELAEGTTYVGGHPTAAMLADSVDRLRRDRDVIICLWPGDPRRVSLPPQPDYVGQALDFYGRDGTADFIGRVSLPAGYVMHPLDAALAPRVDGFGYYIDMFGDVNAALDATVGYVVLWRDAAANEAVVSEAVVSEAVAGPFARGFAEIGVGTHPDHRGNGLAVAVSARVIMACRARGVLPFWNAASQNSASIALAHRLGMGAGKPADVFAWSCMA